MKTVHHPLPAPTPGTERHWISFHYGTPNAGRKAVLQCALHADEIPGLLVGVHLRRQLDALEAAGRLIGEIVLVPMANPIGLSQEVLGTPIGRFDTGTGINFNRGYRHLTPGLQAALEGRLGADAVRNTALIRQAALELLDAKPPATEAEALKQGLQRLALDADTVLDLHCDAEALMHLYAGTPWRERAELLGRALQGQAVLLAAESGDDPFDEAVARHWWELQAAFSGTHPIELGCFSATVELRGEAAVTHALAAQDAQGLIDFLALTGHIQDDGSAARRVTQQAPCPATPLDGTDPLTAPVGGVLVFQRELGARIQIGDTVAEIIDPLSGTSTPITSRAEGVFFARSNRRFARRGERIGKVAGAVPIRSGKLLSL